MMKSVIKLLLCLSVCVGTFSAVAQQKIEHQSKPVTTSSKNSVPKPHTKYRNIIFDLGEVLIKWKPAEFVKNIFSSEIKPPMHFVDVTLTKIWEEYEKGRVTIKDIASTLTNEHDKTQFLHFMAHLGQQLTVIQEGLDLFNAAKSKGYRIYLLSNFPKDLYEIISAKYDFFKQIDGGIISFQAQTVKPEAESYHALLKTYNLDPAECLFLDDRTANIQAAQAHGIDGIICLDHKIAKEELIKRGVLD